MIISTTPSIEGKQIKEYRGIVFGEVVSGVDFMKDFAAGITNIIGGRADAYEGELIDARANQNITQKELSLKTGIPQADISRIENGTRNPSLSTLKKLAQGLGMQLRLEFIPDSAKKV